MAAHVQTVDRIGVSKQHESLMRAHGASDVLLVLQSTDYAFSVRLMVDGD